MHASKKFRFALVLAALSFVGCHKASDTNTSHNDGGGTDSDSGSITTDASTTDAQVADLGSMDSMVDDAGQADAGVDAATRPSGDLCAPDSPLLASGTRDDSLLGYLGDYLFTGSGEMSCSATSDTGHAGIDRAYRVVVPAGETISVTAIALDRADLILNLISGTTHFACEAFAPNCAATSNIGVDGAPEMLNFTNTTDTEFDGFLVVSALAGTGAGDFTLTTTLGTAAAGDTCNSALLITPGTHDYTNVMPAPTFASDFSSTGEGTNCNFLEGGDVVFRVRVPAGMLAYAEANPSAHGDPEYGLTVMDASTDCASSSFSCIASADIWGSYRGGVVTWQNTSDAAKEYFLVVDTNLPTPTFKLTFAVSPPSTTGQTCATATPLGPAPENGNFLGYTAAYTYATPSTYCNFTDFPDTVYSISVPAGDRLTLAIPAATDGSAIPLVNLITNPTVNCVGDTITCTPAAALSFDGGATTTVGWSNTSDATVDVAVIVSATEQSTSTLASFEQTFLLVPDVQPLQPGETCHNATPIVSNDLIHTTLLGYGRDYGDSSSCSMLESVDRVYSVVVPAQSSLEVDATGASVNVVVGSPSDCDMINMPCVATAADGVQGFYNNTALTPVTAYVILGSADGTYPGGDVSFVAQIFSGP